MTRKIRCLTHEKTSYPYWGIANQLEAEKKENEDKEEYLAWFVGSE